MRLLAILAAALLPHAGTFVPGRSLGGVRLGMTGAQVERLWGRDHGVCRGCPRTTWYFTYKRFAPEGAEVQLVRGRVVIVATLWSPPAWHTTRGLAIGDDTARITSIYGPMASVPCNNYAALVLVERRATSAFYVVDGRLWGFGLVGPTRSACLSR
jgi:hypothetical protein